MEKQPKSIKDQKGRDPTKMAMKTRKEEEELGPYSRKSWHATFFTNKLFFVKKVACHYFQQ
jgi:hypothetical protein